MCGCDVVKEMRRFKIFAPRYERSDGFVEYAMKGFVEYVRTMMIRDVN
jgi:hypothetical protein